MRQLGIYKCHNMWYNKSTNCKNIFLWRHRIVNAPVKKEYKTLVEIIRMIELEDDFRDAEMVDIAIKNGDAWLGIWL